MSSYLALFDMDRTLLDINSAASYVRWRHRRGLSSNWDVVRVGIWLAQYRFGVLDAPRVARNVLRRFEGVLEAELQRDCDCWYEAEIRRHILSKGRDAVNRHLAEGHVVALVTSATRYVAEPLSRDLCIPHVVCTELEVGQDGRFTGMLLEPMCFGDGKAIRATNWAKQRGLDIRRAYFYTDSITDTPLLRIVEHPVAVNPDQRLRAVARSCDWQIKNWRD